MTARLYAGTDRALRILLVTKGLDLGGIERVVVDLAVGLRRAEVEVEVALINSARDRLVGVLDADHVVVHRLDGSDLLGVGAARRLMQLVGRGGFDVVHVHGPLPSPLVRVAARRRGGRPAVVTTSHTPWGSLRLATRTAWRATARLDDASVAVSGAVAESLPRRARERAVVIPHGIDPRRVDAAFGAARRTPDACGADGRVTVVSVGSHRDAKNYPNLLQAVRIAVDAGAPLRLVTIGDGPNLDTHVRLATKLGLGGVVTFLPSTDDVLVEIARADVFAVASDYEGQPIVVAEALALGVPVVATAVGRVPEMVNRSVGRVVPPRDPDALAAALTELAGSAALRATMSANARGQNGSWTLDDVLASHLGLYRRLSPGG